MRVLVDITHPVNVHFFKHLIRQLKERRHEVLVTAREKDETLGLLNSLGIEHVCISRKGSSLVSAAKELFARSVKLLALARRFRPDVMVAAEAGLWIGNVGAMLRVPRVVFDQVDRAALQQMLGLTLATWVHTGWGYLKDHGSRHIRFNGFLAQSYLDPRRFKPDPEALVRFGVDPESPYVVLRLVGWNAAHDIGRRGLSESQLSEAAGQLSRHGRVFISAETPLPDSLKAYDNPVPSVHFHDLLALANGCIAEGGC